MRIKHIISLAISITAIAAGAATLDDGKKLMNEGDYAQALQIFREQVRKSPSSGNANYWLGVCLYKSGNAGEAIKYLEVGVKKRVIEAGRYLALANYAEYNFEDAADAITQYESDLKRNKKTLPDDMVALRKKTVIAQGLLDHVEKIVIIDSISVPKAQFYKAYKLPPSAGSLSGGEALPSQFSGAGVDVVHATEEGDRLLWSLSDTVTGGSLHEASRLLDGTWESQELPAEVLADGGDMAYPFLMQDGITIYYAIDCESSVGGYDLFMSRRDIDDGQYLGPQNLGMPYNSPFDDYMLAIDEENNIGWWATDRNRIPDSVTIYTFIPNKTRQNYNSDDEEDVKSRALIRDYRSTWEGQSYTMQAMKAREVKTAATGETQDFEFNVSNGRVCTKLSDFKSSEARRLMKKLLSMQETQSGKEAQLKERRRQYAAATATKRASLTDAILRLEEEVEKGRADIEWTANSIRKLEQQ